MPGAAMECSSAFLVTLMALTMTLSACLTVSVRWVAWRWQVVDRPDKNGSFIMAACRSGAAWRSI